MNESSKKNLMRNVGGHIKISYICTLANLSTVLVISFEILQEM